MQWDPVANNGIDFTVGSAAGGLPQDSPPAGSLARGIRALELLAARESATVAEIAERLAMSRSSAYRLLSTLQGWGWIEPAETPGRIRLGIKAAEVGAAAIATVDATRIVPEHLRSLVSMTGETAFFAVPDHDAMVYMNVEQGVHSVRLSARMGSRRPLYCTALGKAYLSGLPASDRESMLRRCDLRPLTIGTITDRAALDEEIAVTGQRGFAVDREEGEVGVSCVAAPIFGRTGMPIGAVSVAGPSDRFLPRVSEYGPHVVAVANRISTRLGAPDRA